MYWLYSRIKTRSERVLDEVELDVTSQRTRLEIGSDPLRPELDHTAMPKPELEGGQTSRIEMQDQHNWVPEVDGANGHLTTHEMNSNQDWVAELSVMSGA